jgi:FAD/FMN-containing dehydrogenase
MNFKSGFLLLRFLTILTSIIWTVSSTNVTACQSISAIGIETLTHLDALNPQWINAQSHYWSAANADLEPTCAVFPISAEEVSEIVSILQNNTGVPFAVKSGGHNPNVGYSSVEGGVLISMGNLSSTVLSSDQSTVDIGPGARWVEVAEALDGTGLTVVSGRLGKYILKHELKVMTKNSR